MAHRQSQQSGLIVLDCGEGGLLSILQTAVTSALTKVTLLFFLKKTNSKTMDFSHEYCRQISSNFFSIFLSPTYCNLALLHY